MRKSKNRPASVYQTNPSMKNTTPSSVLFSARAALLWLVLALTASSSITRAATDNWSGGGAPNGNWQTGANWGGAAPLANDSLIFAGNIQTLATNDFLAGTLFNAITFDGSADVFSLYGNSVGLITFTNGVDANGTS